MYKIHRTIITHNKTVSFQLIMLDIYNPRYLYSVIMIAMKTEIL